MNLFEIVKLFLSKDQSSPAIAEVPDGHCPNCWGREEYSGQFYEAVLKKGVDINSIIQKKGWIDAYATQHLSGIQLHRNQDNKMACKKCKTVYNPA